MKTEYPNLKKYMIGVLKILQKMDFILFIIFL